MEERFELSGKQCIKDNSPDARPQLLDVNVACVILNEQDQYIKKLEEQNQLLIDEENLISKKMQEVGFDNIEDLCNSQKQLAEKEQRIEEQLKNSIRPKFNRQEHIYCVAFGEIREFVVVAYLDNNITLCEDTTTGKLEWCDNNFLVLTKEEAEAKLREIKGGKED